MELDPKNTDVFQLLEKLKEVNGAYPQDLLAMRRQGYINQVAAISGGAGLALALKTTAKSAKGAALPPAASSVLEGILVIAIVVEAGAVTYFYRDKLVDLYQRFAGSTKVEKGPSPSVVSSPISGLEMTPTPVVTVTETQTPVVTPSLLAEQPTQNKGTGQGGQSGPSNQGGSQTISTPAVIDKNNNGNHYGHTPIPDRTKEPRKNSNSTSDPGNSTDQSKPKKKP